MKKKGSKATNNNDTVTTTSRMNSAETSATQVSPSIQPSIHGDNGTDAHTGSPSKKKKKKKNKVKTTLSAFENAQQHMGAAVAAAAVADFHQHSGDWLSSSSSHTTSSSSPPPPPPPPRQLPPTSLGHHHQHSYSHQHHHHHHQHQHSVTSSTSPTSTTNAQRFQQRNKTSNSNSPAAAAAAAASSTKDQDKDEFWSSMSNTEERQKIREFWLQLGEDERRSLVKVEKEAVLRKMKEQQKHSCNCSVCGKKRTAIEDELEVLYDAYYEELEQYANHQKHSQLYGRHPLHGYATVSAIQDSYGAEFLDDDGEDDGDDDDDDDDDYDDDDDDHVEGDHNGHMLDDEDQVTFKFEYDDEEDDDNESQVLSDEDFSDAYDDDLDTFSTNGLARNSHNGGDHFTFGNSLTVKGGILTVADDLLKNDGKKFLDMMERLAERRMQREDEMDLEQDDEYYDDEDDDDDDIYDDGNEEDTRTEEQRMEEGRRMFQIFAARMFEQRVLAAYREKVAKERQQRLIQELEEEDRQRQERELKKQRDKERKKDKKRQLKQKQEEERLAKEAQCQAEQAKKQAEQQQKLEADRQKREQERRLREEERRHKEEERRRRLKEEKERAAEKEKQRKEKEDRERRRKEFLKEKDQKEKELKEELARRERELKEQIQQHTHQVKERSKPSNQANNDHSVSPPSNALGALSINENGSKSAEMNHSSASSASASASITTTTSPSASASSVKSTNKSANPHSNAAPIEPPVNGIITAHTTTPSEQHGPNVLLSTSANAPTNNILLPPSQYIFGNGFSPLDMHQPSHPLLSPPSSQHPTASPSHHLPAHVGSFPPPINSFGGGGLLSGTTTGNMMEPSLSSQGRSSIGAIGQPHIPNATVASSLPTANNNNLGIAIPSHHGRRSSAMAGPIGSPLTHRTSGFGPDHSNNQEMNGSIGSGGGPQPDYSFFSNFLFGESNRGISSNPPAGNAFTMGPFMDTDLSGHHHQPDKRFSADTSAFGWKNGWSATSLLPENVHGKLFGETLADRHAMLLDRAKVAYQKLDDITQTNFFLGGTTPYHTMAQLHRMMNDLYCDTNVDIRELYDVIAQAQQSGFQCIQHPRHGMVVRYDSTSAPVNSNNASTTALSSSSTGTPPSISSSTTTTTTTALPSLSTLEDPMMPRRPSHLLQNNPLSPSSSFPVRNLSHHHHAAPPHLPPPPSLPIPLASSSSHHLLHPSQHFAPPPSNSLSPPIQSTHSSQIKSKDSG
ncbi:unnamed protein product [Absidia cylindrospora]